MLTQWGPVVRDAGNFAEYLPPLIISLGLLEVQQIFSPFYLNVFGATALGLRLAHTLQLRMPEKVPIVFRQARASQCASREHNNCVYVLNLMRCVAVRCVSSS